MLDNPVGYNRVYVYCGETLTHEAWWEGLKAGRVVVTNGPLLRPRVNDQLPGHVFQGQLGEVMELSVKLDMSLREPVEYLEVVQNGRVVHEVRLDEYRNRKGVLPPVTFETSGWMLVRAITRIPTRSALRPLDPIMWNSVADRESVANRLSFFWIGSTSVARC